MVDHSNSLRIFEELEFGVMNAETSNVEDNHLGRQSVATSGFSSKTITSNSSHAEDIARADSVSVDTGSTIGSEQIFSSNKQRRTGRNEPRPVLVERTTSINNVNIEPANNPWEHENILTNASPLTNASQCITEGSYRDTLSAQKKSPMILSCYAHEKLPELPPTSEKTPKHKPVTFGKPLKTIPEERARGDKVQERLTTQLRDLIANLDLQQTKLKEVQNKFYANQFEELEKAWKLYRKKIDDFNANCHNEYAKIAEIRARLDREKKSNDAKRWSERQRELETQLEKSKGIERLTQQKLSEFRAKISVLEGENKVLKETLDKNRDQIKQLNEKLMKSETSNARLRLQLSDANKKNSEFSETTTNVNSQRSKVSAFQKNKPIQSSHATSPSINSIMRSSNIRLNRSDSQIQVHHAEQNETPNNLSLATPTHFNRSVHWSSPLATQVQQGINIGHILSAENAGEMVNTKYQLTPRGKEFTFANQNLTTTFTILNCDCLLYEYSNGDSRWISRAGRHISVYYYHTREIYEIKIASKTVIRFFTTGQLEIDWKNKDRTIVFPSGVRYEIFQPFGTEIFHMECYDSYIDLANMKMRVFDASGKGQELVPDTKYMSIRVDNSYVAVIGEHLHIYGPDFKLAYLDDQGKKQIKIIFPDACYDFFFCTENFFQVKHVERKQDNTKYNRDCYRHNQCTHFQRR